MTSNSLASNSNSRASELRHFIEMLLVRSPNDDNPIKSDRSFNLNCNKTNEKNFAIQYNDPTRTPCKEKKGSIRFQNINSSENEEEEEVEEEEEEEIEEDEENQKNKYDSHHDLSDLDLGYTKRQSTEYYDDVKRTLHFDDDTDANASEEENTDFTARNEHASTVEGQNKLFLYENTTSTPTKTSSAKTSSSMQKNTSASFKDVSKISTRSKHSISSSLSKRSNGPCSKNQTKKQNVSSKKSKNINSSNLSSGFSQGLSHSMISLVASSSSSFIQTKQVESNLKTSRNNKRIWK
jgi:hypothetical protein